MRFARSLSLLSLWGVGSATFGSVQEGTNKWTYELVLNGKNGKTCKSKQGENYAECAQFDAIRLDDYEATLTLKPGDNFPATEIMWGDEKVQVAQFTIGKAAGEINSVLNMLPGSEWAVESIGGFGFYSMTDCKEVHYLQVAGLLDPQVHYAKQSFNFTGITVVQHGVQGELHLLALPDKLKTCDGGSTKCNCSGLLQHTAPGTIVLKKKFTKTAYTLVRNLDANGYQDWTDFASVSVNLTGLQAPVTVECAKATLSKTALASCLTGAKSSRRDIHENIFLSTPEADSGEVNIQGLRIVKDGITMTVPYTFVPESMSGANIFEIKFYNEKDKAQAWQGDERCNSVELYWLEGYSTPYSVEFASANHLGHVINFDQLRPTGDIQPPHIFTYANPSTPTIPLKPGYLSVHGVLPSRPRGTIMAVPVHASENCQWTGPLSPAIHAFKLHVNKGSLDYHNFPSGLMSYNATGEASITLEVVSINGTSLPATLENVLEVVEKHHVGLQKQIRIVGHIALGHTVAGAGALAREFYNASYTKISDSNILNRAPVVVLPAIPEIAKLETLLPQTRHTFSLMTLAINQTNGVQDGIGFTSSPPQQLAILHGEPILAPFDIRHLAKIVPTTLKDSVFQINDRQAASMNSTVTIYALPTSFSEIPVFYTMNLTFASGFF